MSFATSPQCTPGACRASGVVPWKSWEFAGCEKAEGSPGCGIMACTGRGAELCLGKE